MGYNFEARKHMLAASVKSMRAKKYAMGQHVSVDLIPKRNTLGLHINRNLKEIDGDTAVTYGRNLMKAVKEDFAVIALSLKELEDFKDIETLEGNAIFFGKSWRTLWF